jgi:hypothetical protein
MDVFLDALQAGKDINYVTDYLESAKKLKQPGVTDEMLDEDKSLATNLWAEYRNKSIDENLKPSLKFIIYTIVCKFNKKIN